MTEPVAPSLARTVAAGPGSLASLAQQWWRRGVVAVDSARLVRDYLSCEESQLRIGSWAMDLRTVRRIVVVGAGKAAAGMAQGAVTALAPVLAAKQVAGWVNVPDGCGLSLPGIRVHEARPAGRNAPTPRVVAGTAEILRLVRSCGPHDLCLCLISGGGSALLALPQPSIELQDQVELIDFLAGRGANIQQLNTVRKQMSQVKGGRLARACRGTLATLVISDVLGDPLELIASGPTWPDTSTPAAALAVLDQFDPQRKCVPASIETWLRQQACSPSNPPEPLPANQRTFVIGNIQVAIEAAAEAARHHGWLVYRNRPQALEGDAEQVGRDLLTNLETAASAGPAATWTGTGPAVAAPEYTMFERIDRTEFRVAAAPGICWVSGGEPVVQLANPTVRGLGGRNQQLVLAALCAWLERQRNPLAKSLAEADFCLLSGGTDGEDGPTDAAGAWLDGDVLRRMRDLGLDPFPYLQRNDAYRFFQATGGLFQTGPTGTNVCDLRLALWRFPQARATGIHEGERAAD